MSRRSSAYAIEPWQSKTDAVLARKGLSFGSPTIWTLLAMVAVLLGLTPFVEIDRVVTSTSGKIVATQSLRTFQALDPSIIKSIDVKEGEEVRQGQSLATLDPTFTAADVDGLRRQMIGLGAQIDRAQAEQAGRRFDPAPGTSVEAQPYVALQASLFERRAAQLRAQISSSDEKIRATQASIARIETDQTHLVDREKIAQQLQTMRDTLYKSGSTSLLNLLQASDSHLEVQRSLENDKNTLAEMHHQLAGLQSDRQSAIHQWYTASSQELIAAENQRDLAQSSLDKAVKHQDLVRLVATEPSVVLTLTKLSSGSVLKEGDSVMQLMPLSAPVKAEIQFSAADIGFVRPGDRITLKVDAFSYLEHGTAEGRLDWISEGAFTTDDAGKAVAPFYKGRVTIEKMSFINIPAGFRLIPGMTLVADIDVGRRSLSKYLVGTILHGLGEALREP